MGPTLVDKLFESFCKLEECIQVTRSALSDRDDVPEEVVSRIDQYASIVDKQRGLASDLKQYIADRNWSEVSRHVRLINGLSNMIREDATEILATHSGAAEAEEGDSFLT